MMMALCPTPSVVMAGLDPAIHDFVCDRSFFTEEDVDARVKPGHDEFQIPVHL
jgi:hypothetical protein